MNQPEHKQELMFRVTYSSCTTTVLNVTYHLQHLSVWHVLLVLHFWLLVFHHFVSCIADNCFLNRSSDPLPVTTNWLFNCKNKKKK